MKPVRRTPIFASRPLTAVTLLSFACALPVPAAITLTDQTNITLAASQVESGGDTTDNPDVTGGLAGPLTPYTETGSNGYDCCGGRVGTYGAHNLNDGDIGGSPVNQDGFYAIPNSGTAAVEITFNGGVTTLSGIAIYNGYGNRDDGSYQLRDGAGNVLGAWNISGTPGATNDQMDSFWLTFNSPVTTNRLFIDTVVGDCCGTPSFREIQVFGVPEPSTAGVLVAALLGGMAYRRRTLRP